MGAVKERALQVSALVVALAVWAIVAVWVDLPSAIPPPVDVFDRLGTMIASGGVTGPLFSTLSRTAMGFVIGFIAGVAYGILAHVRPAFGDYTRGLFNLVMFAPTLVLIFLGLVMFGLKDWTVVAIVGLAIAPDVGVYMRDALRGFDNDLANMAASYKVGLKSRITDMYLPFLVPPMLAAARIGFTLAWKIAFLCEVFGFPDGLGWELRSSYRIYDTPGLLSWLIIFILALLVVEQLIRLFEKLVVKW